MGSEGNGRLTEVHRQVNTGKQTKRRGKREGMKKRKQGKMEGR